MTNSTNTYVYFTESENCRGRALCLLEAVRFEAKPDQKAVIWENTEGTIWLYTNQGIFVSTVPITGERYDEIMMNVIADISHNRPTILPEGITFGHKPRYTC